MVNGIQFIPQNSLARMIALIDFETPENNIFRAVNQLTVEYTNNGQAAARRPDVILFVNGMPLCIIELKNPADATATIYDAWEQINIRYWRDIPHLLHYCPFACISDGVKTRLGTVRTPYEHFYAWRRVNDGDKVSTLPFEETQTMIKGVYSPSRFLEIFRDYIYFQDSEYDSDEFEIVCRYPQFFAARLLKQSIVKSVIQKSGKGGTYFGATGCGKTYTMVFLARQLALRCTDVPEIGSPTIVMIVDMWITGFDVPSLTYMYNDKPLKKHMLIQTISRVNRKFSGKEYGLIVDYIGIRDNMREAMKIYGGDNSVAPSADDVDQAAGVFREELLILKDLFAGYDLMPFLDPNGDPALRYKLLAKAAENVGRND